MAIAIGIFIEICQERYSLELLDPSVSDPPFTDWFRPFMDVNTPFMNACRQLWQVRMESPVKFLDPAVPDPAALQAHDRAFDVHACSPHPLDARGRPRERERARACVCVCVCESEREREIEREGVCVCERESEGINGQLALINGLLACINGCFLCRLGRCK